MTSSPTVSVIIATHNRHKELRNLLDDLAHQDLPATEVIVVDSDQADDSTPVVDAASAAGLPAMHVLAPNVLATKRNHGVKASSGDLLIILDDDLRIPTDFVKHHVQAHKGLGNVVASGAISFPEEWVETSNYYRFKQERHAANDWAEATVAPHHFVAMNHSIRRDSYITMGGYDDDYLMYGGEDLDFGHRATRSGLTLTMAKDSIAIHHEVRMTWSTYLNKVHKAAYFGLPLVLAKNPEASAIPTVQAIGGGPAIGIKMLSIQLILRLLSRRKLTKLLASLFELADPYPIAFTPRAYVTATLMANRIGLTDQRRGATYDQLLQ